MNSLEKYLLDVAGKEKEQIAPDNPFREIGFDGDKRRLGWAKNIPFSKIKESLNNLSVILKDKEAFIFIGMGGSINGPKPLFKLFPNKAFYTLDNLDPAAISNILSKIKDLSKTLVIPISKSGTTKETQRLAFSLKEVFSNALGSDKWQDNFLWLSDPDSFGKLDANGWEDTKKLSIQFDNDNDVGGRFSCPHTLIFFLGLFVALEGSVDDVKDIYDSFVNLKSKIHEKAYLLSNEYKDKEKAFFHPCVKEDMHEVFACWLAQLFQESLGSKIDNFDVKTSIDLKKPKDFLEASLDLNIDNSIVYIMAQMYFFQVFVAFYSAHKKINFVNQDFVEKYKSQMRELESQGSSKDIETLDLENIISKVKDKILKSQPFVDIVLYFYPSKETVEKIKQKIVSEFKDKKVSIFVGNDWNHHSYQAAFADKNTFYLLLTLEPYVSKLDNISEDTISKNIDALKTIAQATHLTIKDKSCLFAVLL